MGQRWAHALTCTCAPSDAVRYAAAAAVLLLSLLLFLREVRIEPGKGDLCITTERMILSKEKYVSSPGKGRLWKLRSIWPRKGYQESSSAVAKPPCLFKEKYVSSSDAR